MTGPVPDKYQQAVIDSTDKDVVVLAGAGSGKTFTLVSKIHKLVTSQRVDPDSVLVLTFTRVASQNMRDKYVSMMPSQYDRTPDFCTFHSFCYKVMSEYPNVLKVLGYESLPSVADDEQMRRYVLQAKEATSCKLSNSKIEHPEQLSGAEKLSYEHFKSYLAKLVSKYNVVDYDTLCSSVCQLFVKKDPSVYPVRNRYLYLFVDEFQDTDPEQYRFVQSMDSCNRVLCGDALQNIYQFRGCSNEPLKQLVHDDLWAKYVLPVNYRSTQSICNYVNNVSESFESSKYRVLLLSKRPGNHVRKWTKLLATDKYDDLAKYVKWACRYGNVAVLSRSNSGAQEASQALKSRGVQITTNFGREYLVNLASCLCGKSDVVDVTVSLMSDDDYCEYQKVLSHNRSFGWDDFQKFSQFSSVAQFVSDYLSARDVLIYNNPADAAFVLCNLFDVPQPEFLVESVEEVTSYVLNRVESRTNGQVYVGTVHSVKGLEFDSVAVLGVNSKYFRIDCEERQNILYTALTRAKSNLIVFDESEN